MATSSITHNFVISNPNSVKHFIAAIDEADRDRTPKHCLNKAILSFNLCHRRQNRKFHYLLEDISLI